MYIFSYTDINRAVELLDKLQRTGEVPPQKLQALQRVLQSEFCNAVREVRFFPIVLNMYITTTTTKNLLSVLSAEAKFHISTSVSDITH